jgi:hypothetical protein
VANDSIKQLLFVKLCLISSLKDDNLLLNIDGVVQEVQVTPSYTIKKKEVPVTKERNGIMSFYGGDWRKYTIKYTCCKSKFAISKQKEM